jgi:hypothetical protein
LSEFVQFPLKTTPGRTSAVIPMLAKAKKKSITKIWKIQIIGPLCLLIPQIPTTAAKMTNKSKPRITPKKEYELNVNAAWVKAHIVTPSIANPIAKIRNPPNPVNPFMTVNISNFVRYIFTFII